ncbi:probable WRKY transcription factor 54, partial [Momordica charantia]|uniref:Probable WRKY transcription factor 54 n=1 Tax=Momordica charantia TaxID=3673 RepID=A0A6J1D0A8_MOMCH
HRSYFRCTHKYDQGCKATKQVQKMDDGSGNYKITYMASHTCGLAAPIATVVAADPPLSASNSYNICFSNSGNDQRGDSTADCFVWPEGDDSVKGETTSEVTDGTDILWSEFKDFGDLQEMPTTNQYCFSMGDDADSHVFGMDFYGDFTL